MMTNDDIFRHWDSGAPISIETVYLSYYSNPTDPETCFQDGNAMIFDSYMICLYISILIFSRISDFSVLEVQ